MNSAITRRDLLSLIVRPFQSPPKTARPVPAAGRVAVIQGRHCLALTSFCAACVERCPLPGAITRLNGLPQVVPGLCDGCGICRQVCPAPVNAVLLLPRSPAHRPPSRFPPA
jgi:Fe-S-cluster-containing hydrogenase component 2